MDPSLKPLYNRVKNKRGIYSKLSEDLAAVIQKNFDTEGHRLGTKWEPLKPSTIEQKRRINRASAILQNRGKLVNLFKVVIRILKLQLVLIYAMQQYTTLVVKFIERVAVRFLISEVINGGKTMVKHYF